MITIVAVGKKHEAWVANGVERYTQRLRSPWDVRWVLLPHSTQNGTIARRSESQAILSAIKPADYVILLDERGKLLDSPTLARQIEQLFTGAKNVVLVIGGAYGVSDDLFQRVNLVWSLSPLVFPHQLVRLLVAEQLYRAQQLTANHPYHHE